MDSQLEVCRRRSLPIQRLCDGTSYRKSQSSWKFPHHPLDTTIRPFSYKSDRYTFQTPTTQGAATNISPHHPYLCYDGYSKLPR